MMLEMIKPKMASVLFQGSHLGALSASQSLQGACRQRQESTDQGDSIFEIKATGDIGFGQPPEAGMNVALAQVGLLVPSLLQSAEERVGMADGYPQTVSPLEKDGITATELGDVTVQPQGGVMGSEWGSPVGSPIERFVVSFVHLESGLLPDCFGTVSVQRGRKLVVILWVGRRISEDGILGTQVS
jgi:hypothetical protein